MPYIAQTQRDMIDDEIDSLVDAIKTLEGTSTKDRPVNTEGCINYAITRVIHAFYGGNHHNTSYGQVSKACGVLDNVRAEYYRKVAAPYEDLKELENGPVKSS